MVFEQYKKRIRENREKLLGLSEGDYPALFLLLHKNGERLLKRLLFILDKAETTPNQEGRRYGFWFFCPLSRFATEGAEITRTKKAWRCSIILLFCLGLLERDIPTEETACTPYQWESVLLASRTGRARATEFISIPRYTLRQFRYAEGKAQRWFSQNGNLNRFSKSTIIEVFGQDIADRAFQDERRVPAQTRAREAYLSSCLTSLLETQEYTQKGAVWQKAARETAHSEDEYMRLYRAFKGVWERRSKAILEAAGARQKRPTKAEKEAFGLFGNGWIITRIGTEEEIR